MKASASYRVTAWHFHWRFWRPKRLVGDPVYFGWWATVEGPDGVREMDALQVTIKRQMGLIE